MKKILLIIALAITTLSYGQKFPADDYSTNNLEEIMEVGGTIRKSDTVKKYVRDFELDTIEITLSYYVATGISIGNSPVGDFQATTYPSLDIGVVCHNVSVGVVGGFSSLKNNAVWYQVKTAVSFPVGIVDGYALMAVGTWVKTKPVFIEYGVGISHTPGMVGMFVQVSNWDGLWYLTPGVTFNF